MSLFLWRRLPFAHDINEGGVRDLHWSQMRVAEGDGPVLSFRTSHSPAAVTVEANPFVITFVLTSLGPQAEKINQTRQTVCRRLYVAVRFTIIVIPCWSALAMTTWPKLFPPSVGEVVVVRCLRHRLNITFLWRSWEFMNLFLLFLLLFYKLLLFCTCVYSPWLKQ